MQTVQLTNEEVLNFSVLLNGRQGKPGLSEMEGLPRCLHYAVVRTAPKVQEAIEAFVETRNNLRKEYAKRDEEGNVLFKQRKNAEGEMEDNPNEYQYTDEDQEALIAELEDLHRSVVSVDVHQVSFKDLERGEEKLENRNKDLPYAPNTIIALNGIVVVDDIGDTATSAAQKILDEREEEEE